MAAPAKLRTFVGRVIRDIKRKIAGDDFLETKFAWPLNLASRVRDQERGQRGPKVFSLHAPEVECIGKGKLHRPYELGVKVSIATTLRRSKGGRFAIHAKALPGNPYDGHTLAQVIPGIEQLVGNTIGAFTPTPAIAATTRRPTTSSRSTLPDRSGASPPNPREMRRRSAIEPVIGRIKNEHRMDRNYLAHRYGDANNAILAAVGYNFSLLVKWLRFLLRLLQALLMAAPEPTTA